MASHTSGAFASLQAVCSARDCFIFCMGVEMLQEGTRVMMPHRDTVPESRPDIRSSGLTIFPASGAASRGQRPQNTYTLSAEDTHHRLPPTMRSGIHWGQQPQSTWLRGGQLHSTNQSSAFPQPFPCPFQFLSLPPTGAPTSAGKYAPYSLGPWGYSFSLTRLSLSTSIWARSSPRSAQCQCCQGQHNVRGGQPATIQCNGDKQSNAVQYNGLIYSMALVLVCDVPIQGSGDDSDDASSVASCDEVDWPHDWPSVARCWDKAEYHLHCLSYGKSSSMAKAQIAKAGTLADVQAVPEDFLPTYPLTGYPIMSRAECSVLAAKTVDTHADLPTESTVSCLSLNSAETQLDRALASEHTLESLLADRSSPASNTVSNHLSMMTDSLATTAHPAEGCTLADVQAALEDLLQASPATGSLITSQAECSIPAARTEDTPADLSNGYTASRQSLDFT